MTGKGFAIITIETEPELDLLEFSEACHIPPDLVLKLVEYGALEPKGDSPNGLSFNIQDVGRIRRLLRLQHDLEINLSGAALAIDLMEQIEQLRSQVELLEKYFSSRR